MSGAKRRLMASKRQLGAYYRRAQRALEMVAFERGLQDTRDRNATSGYLFLPRGMRGCRVGPEDAFLDYGSGRGRVLLQAARYPFGRVIGLEQNEPDCEIARSNASIAARRLRCPRIEVVQADATAWPVPDDVTYIYMFNPFWGETFTAVLDRVGESLDRRPRPLTLIYANPRCAPALLATGRFKRVRTSLGPRRDVSWQRIEVFRAIAPDVPSG